MKKDAYYFSHDYNAHSDFKILFMRQQLGMEGYGIYWFIVESLANSGGVLPLKIIPVLAMQMNTQTIKVEAVITKYDLFIVTEEQFFSQRLLLHLELRNKLSESGKEGARLRWGNSLSIGEANGGAISHPNAKERKGKESKVKGTPPEKNDAENFFVACGGSRSQGEKFWLYYQARGWKDVTDWAALAQKWFLTDNEKSPSKKPVNVIR